MGNGLIQEEPSEKVRLGNGICKLENRVRSFLADKLGLVLLGFAPTEGIVNRSA